MSRKKDRQRVSALRRLDPSYPGFRGLDKEPTRAEGSSLVSVTCSVCQKKRNIPAATVPPRGENYICTSCREERGETVAEDSPEIS